ncbi:hypothetical protein POM88_009416 [Heracleum sosnowskyi]|uniref:Uncharacterized protein n=1 Tax=Heracleum sosnowskyi TaxID=360622 RepID=A0AAD8JAK5_9APIA|nr:hypothetical protein POM88_009416 [Heracleum sosnowskyi]
MSYEVHNSVSVFSNNKQKWMVGGALDTLFTSIVLWIWVHRSNKQSDLEESEDCKLNSYVDQLLLFLSSSRSKEPLSINMAMFQQPLLKLTLVDVLEATNNFCKQT